MRLICKLRLSNETEGILRVLKVNVAFFADDDETFWSVRIKFSFIALKARDVGVW